MIEGSGLGSRVKKNVKILNIFKNKIINIVFDGEGGGGAGEGIEVGG